MSYCSLRDRLRRAISYTGHASEAYRGNPKKNKPAWSFWRKTPARIWVVIDVFIGQPEYWLVTHLPLTYPQCVRLRRLFYWQTRLYLKITGYDQE